MEPGHRNVLVIADIEGSSGCFDYESSRFMTPGWPGACLAMTRDADAVVRALLSAGATGVMVKDFHRTGYNILPEGLAPRARLVSGYRNGVVPGIGDPGGATALVMIGMHAPSGSAGFLAHTLTSRIARLEVNGRLLSEAELFSAALAPQGVRPVFFSGCPLACRHAEDALPGIRVFPIDKSAGREAFGADAWRRDLADAAAAALSGPGADPHDPPGPFSAVLTMRDGVAAARAMASRWGVRHESGRIYIVTERLNDLYLTLIRLCYLTPLLERVLPAGLILYHLYGILGRSWVRRRLKRDRPPFAPAAVRS
ncbi:MAG: M55 family metallopeptidase [Spirochaetes bacterium]|nr:M55 family metallopeptidase [Spirochaetota bacterium]